MKIEKLFLSFAAVLHALVTRRVAIEDLDNAIICCTQAEINAANHIDDPLHSAALIALARAKEKGRLILQTGEDHNNRITFAEINRRLDQFGKAPLTGSDRSSLFEIPMRCCVPAASDRSYEVYWAECPTREKNWRRSWDLVGAAG